MIVLERRVQNVGVVLNPRLGQPPGDRVEIRHTSELKLKDVVRILFIVPVVANVWKTFTVTRVSVQDFSFRRDDTGEIFTLAHSSKEDLLKKLRDIRNFSEVQIIRPIPPPPPPAPGTITARHQSVIRFALESGVPSNFVPVVTGDFSQLRKGDYIAEELAGGFTLSRVTDVSDPSSVSYEYLSVRGPTGYVRVGLKGSAFKSHAPTPGEVLLRNPEPSPAIIRAPSRTSPWVYAGIGASILTVGFILWEVL